MGMYDNIIGKFFCPFCGIIFSDMQTKYFELPGLIDIPFEELVKFLQIEANETQIYAEAELHQYCEICNNFISLNIVVSPNEEKG
jgi:hypothetical protein